jgi:hypothetical protein
MLLECLDVFLVRMQSPEHPQFLRRPALFDTQRCGDKILEHALDQ